MEKETKTPGVRRNRLAARFPKVEEINLNLSASSISDTAKSNGYSERDIPKRNIMPAGAEGEQILNGTHFYFDSKEPENNGMLSLISATF